MKNFLAIIVLSVLVMPVLAEMAEYSTDTARSNFDTMALAVGPDLPMAFGLDGDVVTVSFWIHDRESATFKDGTKMYLAGPFDWPFGDIEAKLAKMPTTKVEGRIARFLVADSDAGAPYLKTTKFVAFMMIDGSPEYLDVLDPINETPVLAPYIVEYGKSGVAYRADFSAIQASLKAGKTP